jgi:hypothetical protein
MFVTSDDNDDGKEEELTSTEKTTFPSSNTIPSSIREKACGTRTRSTHFKKSLASLTGVGTDDEVVINSTRREDEEINPKYSKI